ncbi:glycerophosphodiester phosphodiesterase 1 isoform X2 [Cottoperca gobio]|uniref:Glycerophosphodiester phosphodiesterase 1 isoform X2 n=1 Tax=Cottoperca gobio TaxID=56716 RepID=A0A6J2PYM6_COTGO|nr:glycerophosphodiester phosphodiesterase 1-like isoform X2 [Cottoperca gobio]
MRLFSSYRVVFASKNGATGVELDLEFSADGVPILMHDETVDRTTNGSGPLSQMRLSELGKLDAAAKHRLMETFAGEKIPTLEEAVEECIKLQLTIYFDVKGHPDEAAAALKELYKKHPVLYNSSIVCSFEPKVIYRMRQSDPEVVTALTHRPWSLSRLGDGAPRFSSLWKHHWMTVMDMALDWAHHHVLWKFCGISAFLIQKNCVSPDYAQYWAQRGVEVVAWTVNTKAEKDYYQELLQVNYITDSLVEDCEPHY